MECLKDDCGNLQLEHLKAGNPGGPGTMEPAKDRRRRGRLCVSRRARSRSSRDTWITKIRTYLKDNILPNDNASADRIAHLAKRYTPVGGDLYRHGANDALMWCITREEDCDILIEVHGGECGNHASSHMLVGKAFRHGFYWPIVLQDTIELVKSCMACQFHAKQIHTPVHMLQIIPSSWPFTVWGWTLWGHFPAPSEGTDSSTLPSTN
jgi:hypothetical protein